MECFSKCHKKSWPSIAFISSCHLWPRRIHFDLFDSDIIAQWDSLDGQWPSCRHAVLWQGCNFLRIKCLTKISLPLPEASQLNPKQRPVSLFSSSAAQRISPVFTQHEQVMSGQCFERACGMSNMHGLVMKISNYERRSDRSGIHIPIVSVFVTQPQLNPCSVHSCIPPLSCRDNKDSRLPKGLLVPKVLVFILFVFTHVHHGLLAAKG